MGAATVTKIVEMLPSGNTPLPEKPTCCGSCYRCGGTTRPEHLCAACTREITTEAGTDA